MRKIKAEKYQGTSEVTELHSQVYSYILKVTREYFILRTQHTRVVYEQVGHAEVEKNGA